ncbi:MAG: hypothetical protein K1X66_03725 [Verrucomicrobiae bacterium]|nr:hypothetical protein [Verrucomicrobiae bacterium]
MGFVAVFEQALDRPRLEAILASWLNRFEKVEQVASHDVATFSIQTLKDIIWDENLQFRILNGDEFSWVYLTQNKFIIETTGQPHGDDVSLCLNLLTELPNLKTIIPDSDEKRLEELEKQGFI